MLYKRAIRPFLLCILLFSAGCAGQTEELSKRHSTVTYNTHYWKSPPKNNDSKNIDERKDEYLKEIIKTFDDSSSINGERLDLIINDKCLKERLLVMLQNFSDAYLGSMLKEEPCLTPLCEKIDNYVVVSITARPAPSAPTEPFFAKISGKGQGAVLNAVKGLDNNVDEEDLKTLVNLLKTLESGALPSAEVPQTPLEQKFEITISNHLNTGRPYDRIEQITVYLLLDKPGAKFTDINMIESILKEVDAGTAKREYQLSSTFGGEIGGIPLGPTGGAAGVNLSVSPSYSEQFERRFKEALVLRSVQIGGGGKWLSISQNSSQENKIDGSIRHTVTISFPPYPISLPIVELSESNDKVNTAKWQYMDRFALEELGFYYIALASVRCVENGGETIPEKDDEVQQHVALDVGYVSFWESPQTCYSIAIKDNNTSAKLYARNIHTDKEEVAFFETTEEALAFWIKLKEELDKAGTGNSSPYNSAFKFNKEKDRIEFGFLTQDSQSLRSSLSFIPARDGGKWRPVDVQACNEVLKCQEKNKEEKTSEEKPNSELKPAL